jgi:phosphopantothenoylcysteine decarboxylase/phosphopantothenate--cysteine ligase
MFAGKHIIVGITGGIAAYKAVELCRLFVKAKADVRVVMTAAAKQFVTPLTFQTVSGHRVYDDLFSATRDYNVEHVGLAQNAGLIVIAPASANCLAKISCGIADDLLMTTVLAADCPVVLAPAMNVRMYENAITQQNIKKLSSLGFYIVEPEEGDLACGVSGRGRMASPGEIFSFIQGLSGLNSSWAGRRVLVTAGPTQEAIDPVRYLTNHSSGKMGYAVAQAAAERGADVTLVSGPANLPVPAGVTLVNVTTAQEMYDTVLSYFPNTDVVVKAAAVADYRPAEVQDKKIKKDKDMTIALVKNPDILLELGRCKTKQILVGFAAETDNLKNHAMDKLSRKNLDMIVANDVTMEGAGFNTDTNVVRLYFRDGRELELPRLSKLDVARKILDAVTEIKNRPAL